MVKLTKTQQIEILIILGYNDRMRTQSEVCEIFNEKYLPLIYSYWLVFPLSLSFHLIEKLQLDTSLTIIMYCSYLSIYKKYETATP